jgi:uncharacterized protein (DUF427 family)
MAKASWNGTVIAETDNGVIVEGNVYFPQESVNTAYLRESSTTTACPWKGTAHYYSVVVDGETNPDAAWYYPEPKDAASGPYSILEGHRGRKLEIVAMA